MFNFEEELKKLPKNPGVYIMRDDKDVILKAIEEKPIIVKYASKRLRSDIDVGIKVMNKNKKCFKFLEPELQKDEQIQEIKNAE